MDNIGVVRIPLVRPVLITEDQAWILCRGLPADQHIVGVLTEAFPGYCWMIIMDRSGERTRHSLTIDPNDLRVHYIRQDDRCICCDKTGTQLGLPKRE